MAFQCSYRFYKLLSMNFRYDINGLRAIAVLAVVIFHFNPQWLPGGFAGVDVFFVISGFLMTKIIMSGLQNNSFQLIRFYLSRANRIIPALAFLLLVLFVFAWYTFPPFEYKELGKYAYRSIRFISNQTFMEDAGYFNTASQTKWLLHTWSLSVEWQFYIIYPIALLCLKRFLSFEKLKIAILFFTVASFLFSIYMMLKGSSDAYFMLSTRAWEMLFGGIAFLYPWNLAEKNKKYVEFTGLGLIVFSYIFISGEQAWPGCLAFIPVFGAYLILLANCQTSKITNNIVFQNVGKWSYSIYLWHWPLAVFGLFFAIKNWWLYGIPLSIACGYLSFKLIESIKFSNQYQWKEIWKAKPIWFALLIFFTGKAIYKSNGFEWHYPKEVILVNNALEDRNNYGCLLGLFEMSEKGSTCLIGLKDNIRTVLIGDSHADAILSAITTQVNLEKEGLAIFTRSGCPFILNAKKHEDNNQVCYQYNLLRSKELQAYPNAKVILSARFSQYLNGETDPERLKGGKAGPGLYFGENTHSSKSELLSQFAFNFEQTVCSIPKNMSTYIVQPIPEMGLNVPKIMSRKMIQGEKNVDLSLDGSTYYQNNNEIRAIINQVAKKCGAQVLDPAEILCASGKCLAQWKNIPLYRDGDHLSEYGNKLLVPMFKNILKP